MPINVATFIVDNIWPRINGIDTTLITPDKQLGKPFNIAIVRDESVGINPNSTSKEVEKSTLYINKKAFIATLDYLISHNHIDSNHCEIESSNNPEKSGPLCNASKEQNNGTRCITYILPILQHFNVIRIDGSRKKSEQKRNETWLI